MSHIHPANPRGPSISRRAALGGAGAALTLARIRLARAGVSFPQRLVIVNIRGGLDGMSAVVPYGDTNLEGLRAPLIPPAVGQPGGMFDMGGYYGLNPALPNTYAFFQANHMLAVHAVGNISQTRSHFADQGALELGQLDQTGPTVGWINRLVGLLPTVPGGVEAGVSFGADNPAISQGTAAVGAWCFAIWPPTPNSLAALVEQLGAPDPLIGAPTQSGFNDRTLFQQWINGSNVPQGKTPLQIAMRNAGIFIGQSGGPAIAAIECSDADTHILQVSRLQTVLSDFDAGLALLAAGAGSSWANTVVMTLTEFGRTAAVNGCTGTDHGTAFAMMLAGGAVAGGQVIAKWPGLGKSQLYQGRDLAPTTDVRAVIMGVLQYHLGLTTAELATVFPGSGGITPMTGLVTGSKEAVPY